MTEDVAFGVHAYTLEPDVDEGASQELTTAQNAFGQGVTVTVLQMAAAYAAIGNGGQLVTPHVVAGWTGADGTFTPRSLPEVEQVMRPETAATVLEMLTGAIDAGIANAASVPGYSIAGKTGTAQVAENGTYSETKYVASFIGFAPADDPRLLVAVIVDQPQGEIYGGSVAAPAFGEIASFALPYLGVPAE